MFRNITYNKRVALILSICILIPSITLLFLFAKQNREDIYVNINSEIDMIFDKVNDDAIELSNNMYQKIRFITYYPELNDILQAQEKRKINPSLLEKNREISNVMSALLSENNIREMNIYTTNKNAINLSMIKYIKSPDELNFVDDESMGVWRLEEIGTERVLSIYKKYAILNDNYNVIKISVPFKNLISAFSGIKYDNSYISFDMGNADVLSFSYNSGKYEECEIPKGNYYKIEKQITPFNASVNVYINKSVVSNSIAREILIFVLGFVILIFFVASISNIISKRLMRGIMDIVEGISTNNMELIKNSAYKSHETDIIKEHLLELQLKLKEENNEKLNFESKLLAERVSPHFLYNNLAAVKRYCTDVKARKAIDSLISYYRNVFQKGSRVTTVESEIENGVEYLKLLRFSYESNFEIITEVDSGCKERVIPSNIIQPVLENAFIHGINTLTEDDGFIKIEAYRENECTVIKITDNGGNFDEERFKRRMSDESTNHAIKMIIARMKLFYNDDRYTIKISEIDGNTVAEFRFGENA